MDIFKVFTIEAAHRLPKGFLPGFQAEDAAEAHTAEGRFEGGRRDTGAELGQERGRGDQPRDRRWLARLHAVALTSPTTRTRTRTELPGR